MIQDAGYNGALAVSKYLTHGCYSFTLIFWISSIGYRWASKQLNFNASGYDSTFDFIEASGPPY